MNMAASTRPLLLLGALGAMFAACGALLPIGNVDIGLGLSVNSKPKQKTCDPAQLDCMCGNGDPVFVTVPQCLYDHKWKKKCKPCDKMEPQDVCPKFQKCAQCHFNGGDQCATCPPRKYGNWCEYECVCDNGADCDRSGRCLCPREFQGQRCERKKGCPPPPPAAPPVLGNPQPPENPVTVVYSCPPEYGLRGTTVITCLPGGAWSSPPPQCFRKCALLSAPANGRIEYTSSELNEGASAIVRCSDGYQLVGEHTLRCLSGGHWSGPLPLCKQVNSCPEPVSVPHSVRVVEPAGSRQIGPFVENMSLIYSCIEDYELMGTDKTTCLADGRWSRAPGSCLKVSTVAPDCKTPGEDIVAEIGVSVRVLCPPECAKGRPVLWGTSIYRATSPVCPAAVHSGVVTNTGGVVDVISNGDYSHFAGSDLNNIPSQSYEEHDESYRFKRVAALTVTGGKGDCPESLDQLQGMCVHASKSEKTEGEAEAICRNLGLRIFFPESDEEQKILFAFLKGKGITKIWTGSPRHDDESGSQNGGANCAVATLSTEETLPTKETESCQGRNTFVCIHGTRARMLASCEDQGVLSNGKATPVGKIGDIFYVGSSVEYTCDPLHYRKGDGVLYCTANGTWSGRKPTCTRVLTCEEPPVPTGGVVNYFPPLRTSGSQNSGDMRVAIANSRMARLPPGMAALPPPAMRANSASVDNEEIENIKLPPGVHGVGTRAMYECESRYYQLIGSRTRRCETRGNWSGRPPTCIPVCGRSDSPRLPFVVNGNASDVGQWPWQAAVARWLPDYNQWFVLCGGSLLNERWIITAAHCVTYAGTTLPIDPDKFQVYLGKYHRVDSKDDEYVQVKKILEIHIHPDYDPNLFDADIALVQLETAAQLNSRVQPVCLPTEQTSRENLMDGKQGVVTGWGMNENETYSDTLQQAVLPYVSHSICEKGYLDSKLPLTITDNMFCAGFAQGRIDACSGDSGGPMVFLDESAKEKRWILEGIVSWGSPSGCGHPNQYGGFTTVSKFLDWIHLFF